MIPPLLRENLNFRRFFIGQSISLLGDQVTALALPLTAVLALDATAGQMGVLTTLYLIPNLIFSLHAGAWVDRRGRPADGDADDRRRPRPADRVDPDRLRVRPPVAGRSSTSSRS